MGCSDGCKARAYEVPRREVLMYSRWSVLVGLPPRSLLPSVAKMHHEFRRKLDRVAGQTILASGLSPNETQTHRALATGASAIAHREGIPIP